MGKWPGGKADKYVTDLKFNQEKRKENDWLAHFGYAMLDTNPTKRNKHDSVTIETLSKVLKSW